MQKILVAVDESDYSYSAFNKALSKMDPASDKLYLINVKETSVPVWSYFGYANEEFFNRLAKIQERKTKKILSYYVKLAKDAGVKKIALFSGEGNAGESIIDLADKKRIDTIYIGRRSLGSVSRFFLGSTSKRVVEEAHCDVQVVKGEYGPPIERDISRRDVIAEEEEERLRRITEDNQSEIESDASLQEVVNMEELERMRRMLEDDDQGIGSKISKYTWLDEIEDLSK
eukprot:TRINITY_DN238_c0_g1_i1.p1 TRINITY_DN238_c0_g1~~TRINITY_DN238_c0_g1_i1.p1  ORF type:complete len:229 (-),score=66.88 TRINITY_DN238_c0_g1_i1:43-729(-)